MIILLTGKAGVGKSTILSKVIPNIKGSVGGILTKEIRDESGERIGCESISLSDNKSRILAKKGLESKYQVKSSSSHISPSYGVDITVIEEFVIPEIKDSLDNNQITVIDEIGRMQSFSNKFLDFLENVFEGNKAVLATIVNEPEAWSLPFKNNPNAKVIEVTEENRDSLPQELLDSLNAN